MDLEVDIHVDEQQPRVMMMMAFSSLGSLRGLDVGYFWFFMTMMKAIKLFFVVVVDDGLSIPGKHE